MKRQMTTSLFLTTLLLIFISLSTFLDTPLLVRANSGRKIDLFTQKKPYDGRGLNQSSDSFTPQEQVILYALVTYNDAPVCNKLVAFQVNSPERIDISDPIIVVGTAPTNESGIATFSFRIPWPCENAEEIIFGEWFSIATVNIAEVTVFDTLTFRVDWGVKINNINILNGNLEPQNTFLRRDTIVFQLTIENTGLTAKTAAIFIDAKDSTENPIIHIEMTELLLEPGESHVQASSQIPVYAKVGQAVVSAKAYTQTPSNGGVSYSPALHATFTIVTRDIAVISISPSKTIVAKGETIEIAVTVKNNGNYTESFYLSTFYNQTLIDKQHVINIQAQSKVEKKFYWNTTKVQEGKYYISALADPVEGEIDVENNILRDGSIIIVSPTPGIVHDVAATYLEAEPSVTTIGDPVEIRVVVKNLGTEVEFFNVRLFYNNFRLVTLSVDFLTPGARENLTYVWDTSLVMEGNYTIKAYITPVAGEQNTANNWITSGPVWIKAPETPIKTHDVAVTALNISESSVIQGEAVNVTVCVANVGAAPENFNVTVYYDSQIVDVIPTFLEPYTTKEITLKWNTSNVKTGTYTISANATIVKGEVNTENNSFVDGEITIKPVLEISLLVLIAPFIIGLAIILILVLLLYYIRKKKTTEPSPRIIIIGHTRL